MSSKRETILAAALTALSGTSNVSARIYRSRVEALLRDEMPALVVEPIADTPERISLGTTSWVLVFVVIVYVRDFIPDSSADPTIVDVHSKLMGSATLQALIVDLFPGPVNFEFIEADKPQGVITLQFRATYRTSENDITS